VTDDGVDACRGACFYGAAVGHDGLYALDSGDPNELDSSDPNFEPSLDNATEGYGGPLYDYAIGGPVGTYPNPVTRSGSASSIESGAAFNVHGGYPGYYGIVGE
jgi:hypothetical protein